MSDLDLTIIPQDPAHSTYHRESERAKALAHATRVTHKRRRSQPGERSFATGRKNNGKGYRIESIGSIHRQSHNCGICSMPAGGNSDPFDTMPVPVTPANSILPTLWLAHLATNRTPHTMKVSSAVFLDQLYVEDSLHLQCPFYVGSTLLSSRYIQHQGLQLETLRHGVNCYKILRQEISLVARPSDWNILLRRLSLILIAALLANERSEAKAHARTLYDEIMARSAALSPRDNGLDLILCFVHYHDNVCATVYLEDTVLDIHKLQHLWVTSDEKRRRSPEELAGIEWWCDPVSTRHSVVKTPVFDQHLQDLFNLIQVVIDLQEASMSWTFMKWSAEMP